MAKDGLQFPDLPTSRVLGLQMCTTPLVLCGARDGTPSFICAGRTLLTELHPQQEFSNSLVYSCGTEWDRSGIGFPGVSNPDTILAS